MATAGDNDDDGLLNKRGVGISNEYYEQVFVPILYQDAFTIAPLLLWPHNRGYIDITSSDPYTSLKNVPNYFSDVSDVRTIVEGAKIEYAISQTVAMSKINTTIHNIPPPGCEGYAFLSDEYWECQARHYTMTIYHPVGTCKMGPVDDEYAVVDERLRVRGIKGLRVLL